MLPFLLMLQTAAPAASAAPAPAAPQVSAADKARYEACVDLATGSPARGEAEATKWKGEKGGYLARQCLGMAQVNLKRWAEAAATLTEAAYMAEQARDGRASYFWAQAGNAWLVAGDAAKARGALDSALSPGTLEGLLLGEAYLDRARAAVALGDASAARDDLDRALQIVPDDPLAWLLSATLARKGNDLMRAKKDIAEALRRSPDDASVQLEAGNIAALDGNSADAQSAWRRVVSLAPGSPMADAARKALEQFPATER